MKNLSNLLFLALTVAVLGVLAGVGLGMFRFYWWGQTLADMQAYVVSPEVMERLGAEADAPPAVAAISVEKVHDFGFLPEGQTRVSHDFTVKNVGSAMLKLQEISSTCRCTAAALAKKELEPGEEVNVSVTVSAEDISGKFEQGVTFFTNDPLNSEVQLLVKGVITVPVWADTPELNVGRIVEHTPFTAEVKIFGRESLEDLVKSTEFDTPDLAEFFEVQKTPMMEDEIRTAGTGVNSGVKLAITVLPGLPQGAFQQVIRVRTASEKRPELRITLHGIVGDQLSVHGGGWDEGTGTLTAGRVRQGETATRKIWIVAKGEGYDAYEFSLRSVMPDFVWVDVGQAERTEGSATSRTPVTITIPAKSPKCNFYSSNPQEMGCVLLDTGKDENPLRIYLRFLVL